VPPLGGGFGCGEAGGDPGLGVPGAPCPWAHVGPTKTDTEARITRGPAMLLRFIAVAMIESRGVVLERARSSNPDRLETSDSLSSKQRGKPLPVLRVMDGNDPRQPKSRIRCRNLSHYRAIAAAQSRFVLVSWQSGRSNCRFRSRDWRQTSHQFRESRRHPWAD
jgi:hypothetical protein